MTQETLEARAQRIRDGLIAGGLPVGRVTRYAMGQGLTLWCGNQTLVMLRGAEPALLQGNGDLADTRARLAALGEPIGEPPA